MLFLFLKIFIFILVLNIILVFYKNNNVINIYEKIQKNKKFHIRINKSLAEYIKNENRDYESKEFDLLYEELVKQKIKTYQRLMDLRKKEKNYEKEKLRYTKWEDKVLRSKIKAHYILIVDFNKYSDVRDSFNLIERKNKIKYKYNERKDSFNLIETKNKLINKYHKMRDSFNLIERKNKIKNKLHEMHYLFNLIETKNRLKNKLYEIIFKGKIFWKHLGFFLQSLGLGAIESVFAAVVNSLILATANNVSTSAYTCCIVFSGIYGALILLIIITVIVVVLLVVWLWPKDEKNLINKMLEPN